MTVYRMNPQVATALGSLSFSYCFTLCLHNYYCEYFVPFLRKAKASTVWFSSWASCGLWIVTCLFWGFGLFFSFMWSVNCKLFILRFWANIHLSVSAYHEYSFVIGLPQSGWHFLAPYICLRISWIHCFYYLINTQLCRYTTFSVSISLLKDIYDLSSFWLL